MTYELAKKLKNAGFLQKVQGSVICEDNHKRYDEYVNCEKEHPYSPTLSELIEACGDKFVLHSPHSKDVNEECWNAGDKWWAVKQGVENNPNAEYGTIMVQGDTPEEAVANLWLKLHGKN